jgi:micrococcal nuclease
MSFLNGIIHQSFRRKIVLLVIPLITAIVLVFVSLDSSASDTTVLSNNSTRSDWGYKVTRVVDGDTLEVEIDGSMQKVRLIGVDTPETSDPRKEVECFGKESSSKTRELVEGKFVRLEQDETQNDKDRYGRLLRYVYMEESVNLNLYLLQNGYAYEYTYEKPYKFQEEFKHAETNAREKELGLWDPLTCPVQ